MGGWHDLVDVEIDTNRLLFPQEGTEAWLVVAETEAWLVVAETVVWITLTVTISKWCV